MVEQIFCSRFLDLGQKVSKLKLTKIGLETLIERKNCPTKFKLGKVLSWIFVCQVDSLNGTSILNKFYSILSNKWAGCTKNLIYGRAGTAGKVQKIFQNL